MKLTILGQWGAYPKAGEATAGYLIEHKGEHLLLDCGSGILAQLQKYIELSKLSRVWITHIHYDHVADLGCLQYGCLIDTDLKIRSEPLPIHIAIDPVSEQAAPSYKSMMGSEITYFTDQDTFEFGGLRLSFMKTFHGAYCMAVKMQFDQKTVVYTADTYFDESLIDFCKEADLLLAETSFYAEYTNAKDYGHMNTTEVGRLASMANVKKLILTHLPHFGEITKLTEEVQAVYSGEVELARSGLELII
jgi:ribonuclease BN (tRNA processing enzyme)